jgi:ATP-dependent Clp protease adapter protein ClpS
MEVILHSHMISRLLFIFPWGFSLMEFFILIFQKKFQKTIDNVKIIMYNIAII